MNSKIRVIAKALFTLTFVGCASASHHFYDSAINNKNRAPASLRIPASFDNEKDAPPTIDHMHNQAEADFLYLKAEMESNAGRHAETIELLKSALVYDNESPTLMQKLAVEFYKSGNLNDALYWAEKARVAAPERRDLNLLAAGLYTSAKNYGKAEEIYRALVKADKTDTEAVLYLGAVQTEQKNFVKAVETFKTLTKNKTYSSRYLAHYYLARVYSEQNPKSAARIKDELKKSLEHKPDFFEAISMLGQYILKEEGQPKAIAFYENYQQKFGPNLKLAEMLAHHYISKNEFDKAYEQLEFLDEANDDMVQVKLKMALILIDKKIYERAIAKLEEILVIAPESDKVRFYLAAVYEEKRDFKSALKQYVFIDKTSSYFEESRLHAAYISKILGDLDKAVQHLNEVVAGKAENQQTFIFLSQLYEDKKDMQSAEAVLKKAVSKFSESAQVFYHLGMLHDKMNRKSDMMASMTKVIDIEPDHSQALNYLAYSWAEAGEHLDKAESYARKAANKEKDDAFILDTLGWVLYKKGDFKKAVEVLEKAHTLQPDVAIISEHLGDVYIKLNMHDKARALFIKASANESDVSHRKELESKVLYTESVLKSSRVPSSLDQNSEKAEAP
jgi:tetratricopeptide (TPR) repeat protein